MTPARLFGTLVLALAASLSVACSATRQASVPLPQDEFWAALQGGRLTEGAASDSMMRRSALVMYVRQCTPTRPASAACAMVNMKSMSPDRER